MKKQLYILGFLFLILLAAAPMVSAATAPSANDTLAYWAMEDLNDSTPNDNDLTNDGATSGVTGIIDDAFSLNGDNNNLLVSGNSNPFWVSTGSPRTYSVWFRAADSSSDQMIFYDRTNSGQVYLRLGSPGSGDLTADLLINPSGLVSLNYSGTIAPNTWYHAAVTYDGSLAKLYVNGVLEDTETVGASIRANVGQFRFGSTSTDSLFFEGSLDEMSLFDYDLSLDEVQYLYASGSPGTAQQWPFEAVGSNFSIRAYDLFVAAFISNFSASVGDMSDVSSATLNRSNGESGAYDGPNDKDFFVVEYNDSWYPVPSSCQDPGTNIVVIRYYTIYPGALKCVNNSLAILDIIPEGNYAEGDNFVINGYVGFKGSTSTGTITTNISTNTTGEWNVSVFDAQISTGTFNEFSTNLSDLNQTYQANLTRYAPELPFIQVGSDNFFTADNFSRAVQYGGVVQVNLTFIDDALLYGMIFNVTSSNGTVMYNETQTNLSGTTYNYLRTLNTTAWPEDVYNVFVFASDAHTARKIKDYGIKTEPRKLEFRTETNNRVSLETEDAAVLRASSKKHDRYEFSMNFTDKVVKNRVVHLRTTSCPLEYLPDSTYKGHFVSFCGEEGGNWIDFEGFDGEVQVRAINDYHMKVTLKNAKPDLKLRSIGGLNTNNETYQWYRGSYEDQTDPLSYATEPTTSKLIVSNHSTISDINAVFVNNGTIESGFTKTTNASHYIFEKTVTAANGTGSTSYFWNVTIDQADSYTYDFTIDGSQELVQWGVALCNASISTRTINITISDEDEPFQALNASLEVEIDVWVSNESNQRSLYTNFSGSSQYEICIFPSDGELNSDIYIQNVAVTGLTHRYYEYGTTLSNDSTQIFLYNFANSTGLSLLEMTLRYVDTYQFFPNVVAKLQRRYVSEGVWRTVQMDESGDFGLTVFDIREREIDYRLIFTDQDNNVLKTTDTLKFACQNDLCELTQLLSPSTGGAGGLNTTASVGYDNSTRILTLNWNNPGGDTTTTDFLVTYETATSSTTICDDSQTASSGTMTCNLTGITGIIYYQVSADGTALLADYLDLRGSGLGSLIGDREGALWAVFIIAIIAMVGIFSPVGAVISTVIGLVMVFFLGIFTPLTLTFILVAAVLGIAIGIKIKT